MRPIELTGIVTGWCYINGVCFSRDEVNPDNCIKIGGNSLQCAIL
jgi:hypothetical protein